MSVETASDADLTTANTASKGAAFANAPPPDGPSGWPLLGNAFSVLKDPLGYSAKVRDEYGPVAKLKLGPQKMILLQSPEGVRHILLTNGSKYPKPALGMKTLEPLLGKGIATLTDMSAWKQTRAFILPLFSPKMLDAYFAEAVDSIAEEVKTLENHADSDKAINIYDWMHEATFRVLVRTVFRDGIAPEEIPQLTEWFNDVTAYINVRYVTLGLPIEWAIASARKGKRALQRLDKRVFALIQERRESGTGDACDMLDALLDARLESGEPLSDQQIRDNCMTMLFGGHETTAGSITWAWGLLSANPAKREKMLAEVDTILGKKVPQGFPDLKGLPYTSLVFEEAMRLYPMFSFLFREASQDDVIEGRRIQKGDLVGFSAHSIQHDGKVWEDPEAFIPERHEKEALISQPKGAYLPFSHGLRGCIGQRMARMEGVLMLAMLSQHYQLNLEGPLPDARVSMSLKPKNGMWMTVHRRK